MKPKAFIKMSDGIIRWFYKDTDFKRYKSNRLLSINGTILEINNTEKLRNEFRYIENQTTKVARIRAADLYNVENDIIIASVLSKYNESERDQAGSLISYTESNIWS